MKVSERTYTKGIVNVAKELGVTYTYLWKVLSGRCESIPLVLKIYRNCPELFRMNVCRIDWQTIVRESKDYEWDDDNQRYTKVKKG